MNAISALGFVLAAAYAAPAQFAAAHASYLPDPASVEAALRASRGVAQARAEFAAQSLRSESLRSGREEWTLAADALQRRIDEPQDRSAEWGVTLSRPLRLPGRAAADRALATAQTAHAEAGVGEAMHESGRQLLALWFAWLGEAAQASTWLSQVSLAEAQLAAVDARIRLGDAPRADRVQADAALAQARLQQQQADARAQQARSRLAALYPGLPLVADEVLPPPAPPSGTVDEHVEAVLTHNHELMRARRQAEMLRAEARQFASRRGIDPNVGVFYKSEMDNNEHLLGVSFGLTLPGPARRTDQQAAEQLGASAQEAALRLEQQLREEARANFAAAISRTANWQLADRAAQALAETARLAARAYNLGEGSLDTVLLNQRLALEARLMAEQAQLDALSAQARLDLDTHRLWLLDGETAHADTPPR